MSYNLSIIIPARNEMFVSRTVDDILKNKRGKTEIIVGLDGQWAVPPIKDHPDVTLVHTGEPIGQRGITNQCVRLSKSEYIAKCDAHCAFDEGFDIKLMEKMQDDWTMVPIMRNLHAFDWVCKKCGDRRYQGITPTECPKCDNKTEFERDIKWIAKTNPESTSYCFDSEPHFQYFREFKKRPEGKGELTETMSLQGSFFMCTREKYWELDLCNEDFGSWGSQGIEVAVKTWLSGGKVIVNHNTWYGHMFRTKGGDFGFPYPISGRQTKHAKTHAKDLFFNNKWPKAKYPLSWLLEKFWPVPGWTDEELKMVKSSNFAIATPSDTPEPITEAEEDGIVCSNITTTTPIKGIVYYSDCRIDSKLSEMVQGYLKATGLPIYSVTLKPVPLGHNIVLDLERSYLTMFKQILKGIESIDVDIIYLAEHDVLYTPEHFKFTPPSKDLWYYNKHNWQVRQKDGHCAYWDCKKVSQVCGYRELMLKHYQERVRRVEAEGFTRRMGFEPGTHRRAERVDDTKSEWFETKIPNLDIRHRYNLTSSRWSPSQFRNPCKNWKECHVNELPGWEKLKL